MDMRIEKTRRSIINAFLQLRSRRPLEKITVKELAALAEINKATFYLHYRDIYDLSETLERETVQSALRSIQHPEAIIKDIRSFIHQLGDAFVSNERLIKILFEGSRSSSFVSILEDELMKVRHETDPEHTISQESRMMMTYMIYGGYFTYFKYCDMGIKTVLEMMERLSGGIIGLYDTQENEN
ncbi:MAG: TetR/AcrR family transcriptional regulator [Ruminococcus sp.]|nr:TetR/AcrR family transcriptional regulator [Ruminococcus sp.]